MQTYVSDYRAYQRKVREDREQFAGVNADKIHPPDPPGHLNLWFELQRWPGSLLCAGGLYDQPDWTWDLIDIAGMAYQGTLGESDA